MRLNLGGGSVLMEGFINVDLYSPVADVRHDLTKPLPYDDNSIDEIYSSHVIEHFSRKEWASILPDWYRVLKVGGKIEIKCPELFWCALNLIHSENPEHSWGWWIKTIYGAQEEMGEGQFHKNGFTFDKLKSDLEKVGFINVAELIGEDQSELRVEATK